MKAKSGAHIRCMSPGLPQRLKIVGSSHAPNDHQAHADCQLADEGHARCRRSVAVRHDRSQTAFVICGLLFRVSRCVTDEEPRHAKTMLARAMKGAVHELGVLAAAKLGPEAKQMVKPAELRQQGGAHENCRACAAGKCLLK